jgi:tRNA(fMet)-specific endonuclease VapC
MEMRLGLDTNTYTNAARGLDQPKRILQNADEIHLPFVVVAELRAGFACGNQGVKNEAQLTQFLNSPRVQLLNADEQTTHHYARIYAYLRKSGTPVPTNDLWIAALMVQHDLLLYTQDAHFALIPQVMRLSP